MKSFCTLLALLALSFSTRAPGKDEGGRMKDEGGAAKAATTPLHPSSGVPALATGRRAGGILPPSPLTGASRRTLPNGLRVLVCPRHTAPVVTTMMWYRVGSRDELPGGTGMAHFLEHLMFKGTAKLAKGEIDRITYRNGGSNNAFTFNDYTAYEFSFPRANWKTALGVEADRMRNCKFDVKEFDAERQVVMEERRGGQDDPTQQFGEQLGTLTFLAHPYRNPVIGWMEDLKRLRRDDVYAFYRKYYVPNNATLVIAGDVQPEEAFQAAGEAFRAIPALPAPARPAVREPALPTGARTLKLSLPTGVARLGVVFRVPARGSVDVYPLAVLDYALTEGKLSRLYQRLVEQDQVAADVDGGLGIYRDAGDYGLYANAREGVSPERIEAGLWDELSRVREEPLSEQELERAKNKFFADWIDGLETANNLANVLGEADTLGGYEYVNTYPARIQAVTAADVRRVARTYLVQDKAVVGHLYPKQAASNSGMRESAGLRAESRFPSLQYRAARTRTSAPVPAQSAIRNPQSESFKPLRPVERVLPNGMRLILLEKHDLPSVTLSARVDAGALQETDAQAGLAEFVGRMLEQGTERHSHAEIAAALEQVGASVGATVGRETSYATLQTLSKYTDRLLPLFGELVREPSFPAERVEQERERALIELKEAADDAFTVGRNAFSELVYGTHPAHRPVTGTEATVRALRREDMVQFHRRYYRPENCTLVAVGDFRAADLLAKLTAAFEDWKRGEGDRPAPIPAARQTDLRARTIPMDKTQTQVLLGHLGVPHGSPDFLALKVMDAILGEGVEGGFTARIPYQLRDVQGLAYTVGSSITSTAAKEPGVFLASLGTEPGKEKAAVAALLKEIRRIRSAPVSEQELREAEEYLANSYVFSFQTNEQLASYLHATQYYGLGANYRQQFVERVRKISRADVLRVAKQYLDPDHYTLVVVGPQKASPGR